jgi:hypothetical protein
MNTIDFDNCKVSNNDIVVSRKFIYIMIYLYICAVNYILNSINAYFNKKVEEKVYDVDTWYTLEDGKARYKGEWKNGMPNGKGMKRYTENKSYIEGNFVDGFLEGYGRENFDKSLLHNMVPRYEGEFKRDKYHGKGQYYHGDGGYYKGEWNNSNKHGQFVEYSNFTKRTWVGEYENDEKVKGAWVNGKI